MSFKGKQHSEQSRLRMSAAHTGDKNHFFGRTHSAKTKKRMSAVKAQAISEGRSPKNGYGYKGWYVSRKTNVREHYDSLLEKFRMVLLDENPDVKSWTKKHGIVITYNVNGETRRFIPDFLIVTHHGIQIVEEVKGYDPNANAKRTALEAWTRSVNCRSSWLNQRNLTVLGYRKFLKESR